MFLLNHFNLHPILQKKPYYILKFLLILNYRYHLIILLIQSHLIILLIQSHLVRLNFIYYFELIIMNLNFYY